MNCQLETYMVKSKDVHMNMNVSLLNNHFCFMLADGAANLLFTVLACLLIDVPVTDVDDSHARGFLLPQQHVWSSVVEGQ